MLQIHNETLGVNGPVHAETATTATIIDRVLNRFLGDHDRVKPARRKRRSYRRQVKDGIRGAALRAFTAAEFFIKGQFRSVAEASKACGSTAPYVAAAVIIIKSEDAVIRRLVLSGQLSLLKAARQLRGLAALVGAYREGSEADRVEFGRVIGAENLFETAVSPAL
jgi:hypothetical protein